MSSNSLNFPLRPVGRRLRSTHRAEIYTAVLTDLSEHGPSTFSDVRARLFDLIGEQLIRQTLKDLIESRQITAEMRKLSKEVWRSGKPWPLAYEANVYAIAQKTKRKGRSS